jgi:hypothetical protein
MSLRDGPFHPLRIEGVRCDMETARQHLDAFVLAFVRSDRRARAQHILFRLATKHPDRLGALCKLLDDRHTSPPQDLTLPTKLPAIGIYFAGGNEAWLLSPVDAGLVSCYLGRDAVWSGVAGSYAAFLHHEGLRWLRYRMAIAKD